MGNSFFCNRCDIEKFVLSRACADQFLIDDNKDQTSEERWIQKLKCLDDAHSKENGLTEEAFNELVDKLHKYLKKDREVYCKNSDLIIDCLRRNPHCSLNCKREMDDFIDCVDTVRVRKVKQQIQETKKKNKADYETMFT